MYPEERSRRKFLYQKAFFSKISRILRKKFSNFCEVVSGKVVVIPFYFCRGRFQGKYCPKSFFSLFPDLEQKIDYWKNIKMNVKTLFYESGGVLFRKNVLFKVIWCIFFYVFRAKDCKFWKNSRRILKIAFYTSKGTSWWNYFGSLKTFFPWSFRALSENNFANFLGMFPETDSYVVRGPFG